MQKYLEDFISSAEIDADISGYYLGLKPRTLVSRNFEPYIPTELTPSFFCPSLMEYPFTKISGSTKTYTRNENGDITPVLYDYEFSGTSDEEHTRDIQKGVLDFISLMTDGYGTEHVDFPIAYAKLRKITKSPSLKEASLLGDLRYINHAQISYMAQPQSLMSYILHPGNFKADFTRSGWKAGFLKRLFKLPLPYDKMLSLVRHIMERKYN